MSEAFDLALAQKEPVHAHYNAFGVCPENDERHKNTTNFADIKQLSGDYVAGIKVGKDKDNHCSIWAQMKKTGVTSNISYKILKIEIIEGATSQSFNWNCISSIDKKYLPMVCKGKQTINNVYFKID